MIPSPAPSVRTRRFLYSLSLCVVLGLLFSLLTRPAFAHGVILSAYATGDSIEGEVMFSNGQVSADTIVTFRDPDGRLLGQATTDAEGFFSFTPSEAVPHNLSADLGAGHVAHFTIAREDLPASVRTATTTSSTNPVEPAVTQNTGTVSGPSGVPIDTDMEARLEEMIAAAVRQEIRPLRQELAAYKEKASLHSILGGIGFIVGLFGVWFWVAARKQAARD